MSLYDHVSHLADHFNCGLTEQSWARGRKHMIGIEVETQYFTAVGSPMSLEQSRRLLDGLLGTSSEWRYEDLVKRNTLANKYGDRIQYELSRHNIELSIAPRPRYLLLSETLSLLNEMYEVAASIGAFPYFGPLFETDENLLVIPDDRDATWLKIDGTDALKGLAATSSVHFTFDVPREQAVRCLNRLGANVKAFLADFPQDVIWKIYRSSSPAGYADGRYGGPLEFGSINSYCLSLMAHDVVTPDGLKSHRLEDFGFRLKTRADIDLFLRSVWWYFRLRRYGQRLCIEVRPLARRTDADLERQLKLVLDTINL